jgi:hypothetical protein
MSETLARLAVGASHHRGRLSCCVVGPRLVRPTQDLEDQILGAPPAPALLRCYRVEDVLAVRAVEVDGALHNGPDPLEVLIGQMA